MTNKKTQKLSQQLILRIALFSILGLVVAFLVVNIFVRNAVYNNIIDSAQSNMTIYATELDGWFTNSLHVLDTMAATFEYLGEDYIRDLSIPLINAHDYMIMTFVGFSEENRVLSGQLPEGWVPPPSWYVRERPWYVAAHEQPRCISFYRPLCLHCIPLLSGDISRTAYAGASRLCCSWNRYCA